MACTRAVTTFICFCIFRIIFCVSYTSDVKLPQGTLRGLNFGEYNAYLGVPYASVPKRFVEAGPPPSWPDTFYATDGNIKCNQILPILNIPVGREDCLVANIYTPHNKTSSLLPVMIFIHGGGFQYGSNTNLLYDAKYLTLKGVVVVAINYRLGFFGLLCLNIPEASGNMAFKDQIAALKWVNRNIKQFGGDPNLVTLVGESAGATSVQYLSMSPSAKGLFRRTILESGSILVPIGYDKNPLEKAIFIASRLGHNVTDPNEIYKIFLNIDATELTKASFIESKNDITTPYIFQPCVENPEISRNPFLTASPRKLLKMYKVDPNIEFLIGFNNKEGIMFAGQFDSRGLKRINEDLSDILPRNLNFKNNRDKLEALKDIRKLYFGNKNVINYDGLINFFSDCLLIYPSVEVIETYVANNGTVFNYIFNYDSLRNLNKFTSGLPLTPGANHADELFYIFDPILYKILPSLPRDKKIVDLMTNAWASFAKTGIPSVEGINWTKSEKENLKFLSIGNNEIKMTSLPFQERMKFWRNLYQKYAAY